jgi:hypothetical protein
MMTQRRIVVAAGCAVGCALSLAGTALGQVTDGSFEAAGPAGPLASTGWLQSSGTWGSPLCDGSCSLPGTGTLARSGNWFAWFGGTGSFGDSSLVRQTVNVPAGVSTVTFWFRGDSTRTDNADFMTVRIDGSSVLTITSNDVRPGGAFFGSTYRLVTVNVPGGPGPRVLEFSASVNGGFEQTPLTNFLVDDVSSGSGCVADCDGSGGLSPSDFTCFLSKYRAGDPYGDCDGSGSLSPADFTCYLGKYRAGCP